MNNIKALAVLAAFIGGVAGPARSTDLQSETLAAWQAYLRDAGTRMQARLDTNKPFLWIDETADRKLRVQRGEIVVEPVAGRGTKDIPNGLIHDWIGGGFIPNATVESLLAVVQNYDSYKEIYKPAVTESKSLGCNGGDQKFSMIWQRHVMFVNAAIQGQYYAHNVALDSRRGYSVVDATRVQEIEQYGSSDEHLLAPDTGSGFIWRIRSIVRYEQRDGGVYLEIEAIALSRDISPSLRWMVTRVVNHLSSNSLKTTLHQTRQAVQAHATPETLAMCERKSTTAMDHAYSEFGAR